MFYYCNLQRYAITQSQYPQSFARFEISFFCVESVQHWRETVIVTLRQN